MVAWICIERIINNIKKEREKDGKTIKKAFGYVPGAYDGCKHDII